MPRGKVGIIVDGSTPNTELTINPLPHPIRKGYAHSFAYGRRAGPPAQHRPAHGQHRPDRRNRGIPLRRPLRTAHRHGTSTIDRIAFNAILPGASILTGGTVNTLDILQGITLNTGTNIQIGRDINLLNVGRDINLRTGRNILIGRDWARSSSPPRGPARGATSCRSTCLRPPRWWQRPRNPRFPATFRVVLQ